MSNDTMAERLYGGTSNGTSAPAATPAPSSAAEVQARVEAAPSAPETPTDPQVTADRLFGEKRPEGQDVQVPEHITKLRAEDAERRMWSAQKTHAEVPTEKWFPADAGVAREMREMIADVGLSSNEALELATVGAQLEGKLPTAEQRAQWRSETTDMLARQYGKDAPAMLDAAAQLIRRDPRIAGIADLGFGDHPAWVAKFIELARRERTRGRL